jgi:hypothetical protein
MTTMELDKAKVEAFGGQMVGILNGGLLALMTSIGHRTGLFDRMAEMAPSTSQEIADAASLNERYVGRAEADRCLLVVDGVHGFANQDLDVATWLRFLRHRHT